MPTYVADAGLKSFTDIAKFKDKLDGKIYGIEPGNDGNRIILDMIAQEESTSTASNWSNPRKPACWPRSSRR